MTFKPTSGLSSGLAQSVLGKTLTTSDRKNLSDSSFVFPGKAPGPGSYPIPDISHARNALSRAAGKPEEAAVKRAVYSKFPQLKND